MKATNEGTCQICERRQRLPIGKDGVARMAKHGYTVEGGFFNGVCPGADNLPYEQSCELIPPVIGQLSVYYLATKQRAMDLRLPATEPKGGIELFGRFGYHWTEVPVVQALHDGEPCGWNLILPPRGFARAGGRVWAVSAPMTLKLTNAQLSALECAGIDPEDERRWHEGH